MDRWKGWGRKGNVYMLVEPSGEDRQKWPVGRGAPNGNLEKD